ncbi:MAG: DUF1194 domain-containing protein [Pseudomonadota bacterium]
MSGVLGLAALAQDSAGSCRQALALGLDVSGSVDAREYRLQLDGLADAFDDPNVRTALFALPHAAVEVLVYEWSGADDQFVLIPWVALRSPADVAALQDQLRVTQRRATSPGTALGHAMNIGFEQLQTRSECWKLTLDVSGDGKSNSGPEPKFLRDKFVAAGMTVNALVIGADAPGFGDLRQEEIAELSSYFRVNVIAGEDAFVQTALGYEAYAQAMSRKLTRELQTVIMSQRYPRLDPLRHRVPNTELPPRLAGPKQRAHRTTVQRASKSFKLGLINGLD